MRARDDILDTAGGQPRAAQIGDDGAIGSAGIGITMRHAFSASSAGSPIGTTRSLAPLPARTVSIPISSSISRQSRPDQLADAQPGGVEHFDNRAIAQRGEPYARRASMLDELPASSLS